MSGLVSTLLALKSTATRIPAPAFEAAAMSEASDLDLDEKQLTAATVGSVFEEGGRSNSTRMN